MAKKKTVREMIQQKLPSPVSPTRNITPPKITIEGGRSGTVSGPRRGVTAPTTQYGSGRATAQSPVPVAPTGVPTTPTAPSRQPDVRQEIQGVPGLPGRRFFDEQGREVYRSEGEQLGFQDIRAMEHISGAPMGGSGIRAIGGYAEAAFTHPFQSIGTVFDPNRSMGDLVFEQSQRDKATRAMETVAAGITYASLTTLASSILAKREAAKLAATKLTPQPTTVQKGLEAAKRGSAAYKELPFGLSPEELIAVNAKNAGLTSKVFDTLLAHKGLSIAGGYFVALFGSYPFTKFIKEESLQQLSFAANSAEKAGDVAGMEAALDYQDKVLNPELMHDILDFVPGINTVQALRDFYGAADLAKNNARRRLSTMKEDMVTEDNVLTGTATPEEVDDYIERNPFSDIANSAKDERKAAERLTDEEYYAKVREERLADKEADRLIDEAYFAGLRAQKLAQKASDRRNNEAYYAGLGGGGAGEFETPSTLNFGLLKTPGGYDTAKKGTLPPGSFITDTEEIAQAMFGMSYEQLNDLQRQFVDQTALA